MDDRFSLRFQSTERRGEVVRIPRTGLTVGRKPGNSLQILDNSVSGKHAEFVVEEGGVRLRDLGSTNGTRVGPERVLETRLTDGAQVTIGNVEFLFNDTESEGPALEGEFDATPAASVSSAGDGLERVDASLVARAGKRSPAALAGLGVAVLAAVGIGAWFFLNPSKSSLDALTAVAPVPGNLLAEGYSFEGDRDPFGALETAPQAFLPNTNARRSGGQGVRAELGANEWAEHRSPAFRAGAERLIRALGWLRTRGEVEARVGVEFSVPEEQEEKFAPITAWSAAVGGGTGFVSTGLDAQVPPGYSLARIVLAARATGSEGGGVVDADDVSALEVASPRRPAAELAGAALDLHGDPPIAASLARIDRPCVTGIQISSATAHGAPGAAQLAARVEGAHIVLTAENVAKPARLFLRVEGQVASGGLASTGKDGYRTAGAGDEREGVETLLLGRGADLVRVVLPGPCSVRGARDGAAIVLTVELGALEPKVLLHLDFSADKGAAEDLAHKARGAEKRGELGLAIAGWKELLDRFPYEAGLVEEAEATRAKLVQEGLSAVREVRAEAERARFFALPNLYVGTRERALAVAARYVGSEVETDAAQLAAALDTEASGLRQDEDRAERERLAAVLQVLEKRGAQGLAGEVRARLEKLEGPR